MTDNVGNPDARPDLDLEQDFAEEREEGTISEQEMAEAEAGCGEVGVSVPLGGGRSDERPSPRRLRARLAVLGRLRRLRRLRRTHRSPPVILPASLAAPVTLAAIPLAFLADQPTASATAERVRWASVPAAGLRPSRTRSAPASRLRASSRGRSPVHCNLSCAHCRAAAEFGHYHGELSLDKIKEVVDDIVTISNPIIILTGGEPLMRPDIWEIIDYCHEKGAMPVIGTNATLITDDIAQKMAEHKIPRISVSIDFPTAAEHDKFRGQPGCFDESIEGIKIAKRHGIGVQINTTVTTLNADKIDEIHDLAEDLGVDAFHIFMLVPTGRGSDMLEQELPPEEYERVLTWAYHRQKTSPLHFKPTDSPHYYRIIRQLAKEEGKKVTREEYGLDAMTRGCLGGITFCFVSHVGDLQPCGYFDMQLGNVKEKPFSEIWTESKVFNDLRDYSLLKGKCGACEYKAVCGGCRARALEITGDYLAEEPYCIYEPPGWTGDCETVDA